MMIRTLRQASKPNSGLLALLITLVCFPVSSFRAQSQRPVVAGDELTVVRQRLLERGYNAEDLAGLVITDHYVDRRTGVGHTWFRQTWQGRELFGTEVALHRMPNNGQVHVTERLVKDVARRIGKNPGGMDASAALRVVLDREGMTGRSIRVKGEEAATGSVIFHAEGISTESPRVRPCYVLRDDLLVAAWNVNVYLPDGSHWWNIRIDAASGEELERNDWVAQCRFDEPHVHEHQDHAPEGSMAQDAAPNDLRVFAVPLESPSHGPHTVQNAPWLASPIASPFGWNDTDGTPGPEFTITRGNNVLACEDRNADNNPGYSPNGGPGLDFDFPFDPTQAPLAYEDAAITNLFYWNNIIHDITYHYGFDELSGNFQQNNYGRGGVGNDHVFADAQDGSGTNNANFGTPPDGFNPRMQMFVWTQTSPNRDSDLDNGVIIHEYGHGISNRLVGGPGNVDCLWNQEQMGEGWSDYFGLMLTMRPGDTGPVGRGIGTYVLGQPVTGTGIRPAPYSTNFGVNAYTYASTNAGLSVPHGIGFVWCTILWEMTWELIGVHGFDPDLYNGTGGNNIALNLVMEGLKLTPCNPGFVDGRDAILLADQLLYNGANQNALWAAFARRGLGFSASQGSSSSRADQVEAFDVPLANNVGMAQVVEPQAGVYFACVNQDRPVKVRVRNNGLLAQSNIPIGYRLGNGPISTSSIPGPLASGQVVEVSFPDLLTIPAPGVYQLKVWTALAGDMSMANDTITVLLQLLPGSVVQAPFLQDLEAGSQCGTANNCGGTVCALPGGWYNVTNGTHDDIDWRIDVNGTPTGNTGPSVDLVPGTASGKYIFLESSDCYGKTAILLSPCIDLSGMIKPRFRFGYHLFGATMGSLRLDLFDGEQWHMDIMPPIAGNQGNAWVRRIVPLDDHAGGTIMLRFRGITGTSFTSDMALDALEVFEAAIAPEAAFDASPTTWCAGGVVQFTESSLHDPTAWQWTISPADHTFVDGTTANSREPRVRFHSPGIYSVTLQASNAYGSANLTRMDLVTMGTDEPVALDIWTDRWGAETTWHLRDLAENTYASGGPYTTIAQNAVVPQPRVVACLPQNTCYVLSFFDSYGDGMCCAYGAGGYVLTSGPGDTLVVGNGQFTTVQRDTFCLAPRVRLSARAFLDGAYEQGPGLMRDQIRTLPSFPLAEPYSALGYAQPQGGGEVLPADRLFNTGPDAVVDWIRVELRDPLSPTTVLGAKQAVVQRDGDIMSVDGALSLSFPLEPGSYHVAIRHRNHLGVMTAGPVTLGTSPAAVDMTLPATSTYGSDARKAIGPVRALWSGNVVPDANLKYAGSNNDRDPILVRIGGAVPTATTPGYWPEDINLDGVVKYAGSGNDRDPLLQNVGGAVPTNLRPEQLP